MTVRVVAGKDSIKLEMEPGTYWWCQCGRSGKQPFCDGSHMGTGLSPLKVHVGEKSSISWCACKHTHTGPCCDGTHKTLP